MTRSLISLDLYCDLGSIHVEYDAVERLYSFSLGKWGVIYTIEKEKITQSDMAWRPGLSRAIDLIRTFS